MSMKNVAWFKNQDNVSYCTADAFFANFGKEAGISNFREKVEAFVKAPTAEGITLIGTKRTSVRVFIPDLTFDEHIEMGEYPWVFVGAMYPAYCIYDL